LTRHPCEGRFGDREGEIRDREPRDATRDIGGADGGEQKGAGPPGGHRINRDFRIDLQGPGDCANIPLVAIGEGPVPSRDITGQSRRVLKTKSYRCGSGLRIDPGPGGGGFEIVVIVRRAARIIDDGLIPVRPSAVGRTPVRGAQVVIVAAGFMGVGLVDRQVVLDWSPASRRRIRGGSCLCPREGRCRRYGRSAGPSGGKGGSVLGASHLVDQHVQPEGFLRVIPVVRQSVIHPVINIRCPAGHHTGRGRVALQVGVGRPRRADLVRGVTQLGPTLIEDDRGWIAHTADERIIPRRAQTRVAVVGKPPAADTSEGVRVRGAAAGVTAEAQVRLGGCVPGVDVVPAPVPGQPKGKTVRDGNRCRGRNPTHRVDDDQGGL